jgi:hypothetical protein
MEDIAIIEVAISIVLINPVFLILYQCNMVVIYNDVEIKANDL